MGRNFVKYILETSDTIPDGVGFAHYGSLHCFWLGVAAVVLVAVCILYRRLDTNKRCVMRKTVALLIIANELFKMAVLLIGGNYEWHYLPLHLCSINIILIAFHALRGGKVLGNYLYTVGIPGALVALLFPTWNRLPAINLMCIHSFTVHIQLVCYPLMLFFGGDIRPDIRKVPACLLLLGGLALVALGCNLLLDTNFMFLMYAGAGNPLKLFEDLWGNHLWGFAVIIPAVIAVMHVPILVYRRCSSRHGSKIAL